MMQRIRNIHETSEHHLKMQRIQTIDPTTEKQLDTWPLLTDLEVQSKINKSYEAYQHWKKLTGHQRGIAINNVADILQQEQGALAPLITAEMGKPLRQSKAEIEKCIWLCRYCAENEEDFLSNRWIRSHFRESFITHEPLGIILGLTKWSSPFWQVFRFAVPALIAGNTVMVSQSCNIAGCTEAINRVFASISPANIFCHLLISDQPAIEKVIQHPSVRGVSFSGGTQEGREVASIAARQLKKTVLELSGNDPYIILEDADLVKAAKSCIKGCLKNNGQSQKGARRFIVQKSVAEEFGALLTELIGKVRQDDPMKMTTDLGPMANRATRESLHRHISETVRHGATTLCGGEMPTGTGFYYPATVLTGATNDSPACSEELLGPVASIIPVTDWQDAIDVANDSAFGLGAAIFTKDISRGKRLARKIEAGNCFINGHVQTDPRFPFGGIKDSGYGRKLSSYGIKEFTNVKTIAIGS